MRWRQWKSSGVGTAGRAKKSFWTFNSPICRYRRSMRALLAAASAEVRSSKTLSAYPAAAVRFRARYGFGCEIFDLTYFGDFHRCPPQITKRWPVRSRSRRLARKPHSMARRIRSFGSTSSSGTGSNAVVHKSAAFGALRRGSLRVYRQPRFAVSMPGRV